MVAFAITGIMEAKKKKMDIIGVYVVSMVTAFGGGTVRDVLIGHYPLHWVADPIYSEVFLALVVLATPLPTRIFEHPSSNKAVLLLDAVGLGMFAANGVNIAYQQGCDWFISILFGVVTAVFGGVFRDIICNELPTVFRRNELYATCAFAGSCIYLLAFFYGYSTVAATILCLTITVMLRILSVRYRIRLPY